METNLHRLVSNEAWEVSMETEPREARTKALINREVCKRIFWSLCREDWYSINWRKTFSEPSSDSGRHRKTHSLMLGTALRPEQISTPLPLNCHDW